MADFPDRSNYTSLSKPISPGVRVGEKVMIRSAEECKKSFDRHASSEYPWIPDMENGMCGNSLVVSDIRNTDGGQWIAIEVPQELYDPLSDGPALAFLNRQGLPVWFFHADAVFTRYDLLLRRYSLLMKETVGGMVKAICEDWLHGFCQSCYLIKKWHDMLPSARLFTICSLLCALIVSISGPIDNLIKAFRLRSKMAEGSKLGFLMEESQPGDDEESKRSGHGKEWQQQGIPLSKEPSQESTQVEHEEIIREHRPADVDPFDLILQEEYQDIAAHGVLVFASILYWLSMGVMPIVFRDSLQCGGSVSAKQISYFVIVVAMIHVMELYVMVQTVDGYIFFRSYLNCRYRKKCDTREEEEDSKPYNFRKEWKGTLACCLSILAKFDTFSDVTFTVLLCKCEPITWVSVKGVVLHLPCELHKIAVFGLVFGVFAMQAIPGVTYLATKNKKWLAVALQLNEFRNLLGLMADYEARSKRDAKAKLARSGHDRKQIEKPLRRAAFEMYESSKDAVAKKYRECTPVERVQREQCRCLVQ